MKLYYSPGSCSLSVHIFLEEIGISYDKELISAIDGTTRTKRYSKINPKGRVPALDIGDGILTEAPAILMYLAQEYTDGSFLGDTPLELARILEWMNWLSSSVHALPIAQCWRTERFTDDQKAFDGIQLKGMNTLSQTYAAIDYQLKNKKWALGDQYTIVDPYLLVFFRWGKRLGLGMQNQFSHWTQHANTMLQRPAVIRALNAENISVWE